MRALHVCVIVIAALAVTIQAGPYRRAETEQAERGFDVKELLARLQMKRSGTVAKKDEEWSRRGGETKRDEELSRRGGETKRDEEWSRRGGETKRDEEWSRRGGETKRDEEWSRRGGETKRDEEWSRRDEESSKKELEAKTEDCQTFAFGCKEKKDEEGVAAKNQEPAMLHSLVRYALPQKRWIETIIGGGKKRAQELKGAKVEKKTAEKKEKVTKARFPARRDEETAEAIRARVTRWMEAVMGGGKKQVKAVKEVKGQEERELEAVAREQTKKAETAKQAKGTPEERARFPARLMSTKAKFPAKKELEAKAKFPAKKAKFPAKKAKFPAKRNEGEELGMLSSIKRFFAKGTGGGEKRHASTAFRFPANDS